MREKTSPEKLRSQQRISFHLKIATKVFYYQKLKIEVENLKNTRKLDKNGKKHAHTRKLSKTRARV